MKNRSSKTINIIFVAILLVVCIFSLSVSGQGIWRKCFESLNIGEIHAENYLINLHFLSTGQSDCVIIDDDGYIAMVDTGNPQSYGYINDYLNRLSIAKIDMMIISHFDMDHCGSLEKFIEEYSVDNLVVSEFDFLNYENHDSLEELCNNNSTEILYGENGVEFQSQNINFDIISPNVDYGSENDNSLVIRCEYLDFSMLLTGDMTNKAINNILQDDIFLVCDILKVPHHGSETGINQQFLDAVRPKYSIILADRNKMLPSYKTVTLLELNKTHILNTAELGNVMLSTNGDGEYALANSGIIY